jgi:hypothetical protein
MLHRNRDGTLTEISRAAFPNDAIYYKRIYASIVAPDVKKRDNTENNKKSKNVLKA